MLKYALALMGLTLTVSANAAILSVNSSFGANTITRDTDTGLDWLDVTESLALSYNQVTSQMGVGGTYEGWRYATMAELDQLIVNFGYVAVSKECNNTALHCDSGYANGVGGQEELIETMIRTLGDTGDAYFDNYNDDIDVDPNGAGFTRGILGTNHSASYLYDIASISDRQQIHRADGTPDWDAPDQIFTSANSTGENAVVNFTGSFLVQVSPVPVPASVWLFGSALVGLVGIKRRK